MTSKLNLTLALVFFICAFSTVKAQEDIPAGVWLMEKGDARIQISQCGSTLCGKVVRLREHIDLATGKPQIDSKNPNPSLASRSNHQAWVALRRYVFERPRHLEWPDLQRRRQGRV